MLAMTIPSSTSHDDDPIARLLARARSGDRAAERELVSLLYEDLHRLALVRMRGERLDHSLQATALVNEVYIKLSKRGIACVDLNHFLALAAKAMRDIVVDHARKRKRRGDRQTQIDEVLFEVCVEEFEQSVDLLSLDEALRELALCDVDLVAVVELRFFAGMTIQETARVMGKSMRTVQRDWSLARSWLKSKLGSDQP